MTDRYAPIKATFGFVASLWILHLIVMFLPFIQGYGIVPRSAVGLIGIIAAPFLHGDLNHLMANTGGLIIFGVILSILEGENFFPLVIKIVLIGGALTWLMARNANHIGASGLVFGLFGYLLLKGLFTRSLKYILVSLVVLVSYGGMIFGVLPSQPGISWEGHLFGFLAGGILSKT